MMENIAAATLGLSQYLAPMMGTVGDIGRMGLLLRIDGAPGLDLHSLQHWAADMQRMVSESSRPA